MADLKTTYKDDVLNTSQNDKRKYNMITNADGTVSLEDVTVYQQNGDSFGAADINATNEAVNQQNNDIAYNLIPYPYYSTFPYVHNGITYTINSDGSITAKGVATEDSNCNLFVTTDNNRQLKPNTTYTLSGAPNASNAYIIFYACASNYTPVIEQYNQIGSTPLTFTTPITSEYVCDICRLRISAGTDCGSGLTFYPMLEEGTASHDYIPYAGGKPVNQQIINTTKNTLGERIDISSYNSASNMYTFPSDGYLNISFNGTNGAYTISTFITGSTDLNQIELGVHTDPTEYASYQNKCLYVRKGMRMYVTYNNSNSNGFVWFMPLE